MPAPASNRISPADCLVREAEECSRSDGQSKPVGDDTRRQLFACITEMQMQQKQVKEQLDSYLSEHQHQQEPRAGCCFEPCAVVTALRNSVLPKIIWQLALSGCSAVLIAWLHERELVASIEPTAHELIGIVLGFLLGFRTESSAKRYEDGTQNVSQMHCAMREFGHMTCKSIRPPRADPDEVDSMWREVLWLELAADWPSGLPEMAQGWVNDDKALQLLAQLSAEQRPCWKVVFRLLRLAALLFGVACRDLQKGVANGEKDSLYKPYKNQLSVVTMIDYNV